MYKTGVLGACLGVFGETVTYTPATGEPYEIQGIFNEIYQEVDSAGAIVQSARPNLGVRVDDLAAKVARGDKVTLRGVTYRVLDNQTDGEGGTTLLLHVDND